MEGSPNQHSKLNPPAQQHTPACSRTQPNLLTQPARAACDQPAWPAPPAPAPRERLYGISPSSPSAVPLPHPHTRTRSRRRCSALPFTLPWIGFTLTFLVTCGPGQPGPARMTRPRRTSSRPRAHLSTTPCAHLTCTRVNAHEPASLALVLDAPPPCWEKTVAARREGALQANPAIVVASAPIFAPPRKLCPAVRARLLQLRRDLTLRPPCLRRAAMGGAAAAWGGEAVSLTVATPAAVCVKRSCATRKPSLAAEALSSSRRHRRRTPGPVRHGREQTGEKKGKEKRKEERRIGPLLAQ
ncbi:hypothetical protein PVAP13_2KG150348 [Panicum virgatum]|uniref:Uncharacterized protein n=1 Tax=Panicum virgatum TaxID=38727 RepID=A0A8T0W3G6_PANVG|nr:hypothetical protein PVAP13_2KG150348 [Panicum virgatum]